MKCAVQCGLPQKVFLNWLFLNSAHFHPLINIRDPLGIIMGPITSWQIDGEAMEQ